MTDPRANLYDWDRPPVLPKEKIRAARAGPTAHPRGTFFNTNKATPMAYVNLATAERLFASRYGRSRPFASRPAPAGAPGQTIEQLDPALARSTSTRSRRGWSSTRSASGCLTASQGGTDFGGLFLGFSFFLIAAALMLVGLLFRLSLDRRAKEVGLLLATGYAVRTVRRVAARGRAGARGRRRGHRAGAGRGIQPPAPRGAARPVAGQGGCERPAPAR